jgi:hypothetical protein
MLTALATPAETVIAAMQRHNDAIQFIDKLLKAAQGQSFEMPTLLPEVHNALLGLRATHWVHLSELERPGYEAGDATGL